MSQSDVAKEVRRFIKENFMFNTAVELHDDQSLVETGVVDSTGVLELIAFLEENYNVRFADDELVDENFASIARVAECIVRKIEVQVGSAGGSA